MKVVLFCGGYGMRMRTAQEDVIPKPLQMVGPRPLVWHVMQYYAHHGHKDFILCLGYGAEKIKEYFLRYNETPSNDFVLSDGKVQMLSSDIAEWSIHLGLDDSRLRGRTMPIAGPGIEIVPAELVELGSLGAVVATIVERQQ